MTGRAALPPADETPLVTLLAALPELERLRTLHDGFAQADDAMIGAVVTEANRIAAQELEPLNATGDADPPRLVDGRVRLSARHHAAWRSFAARGWLSLDMDPAFGGQGLPLVLALAVQEIFDRACPAFGMLPVPIRSAARMIAVSGSPEVRARWLPLLASGEIGATICISESGAGSDVARLRTHAHADGDAWLLTGEKQWISYGDHDLTPRILHCVLARDPAADGLSLFLVPSSPDTAGRTVVARRLEEKLGLHLSPTCVMGLEAARAERLGPPGRGLQTIFGMITRMRLTVGAMGLGIAVGAFDVARAYAAERRQGGKGAQPVAIADHADVARMLASMRATTASFRSLLYTVAAHADLVEYETDAPRGESSRALVEWLLPVIKTLGGEIAFDVASEAIQVLGGAGYTRDWPVEQALRDARVLTIFEGTTGIQAADLLQRGVWRGGAKGLAVFLAMIRDDLDAATPADRHAIDAALAVLEDASRRVADRTRASEGGAVAYLHLVGHCAMAWAGIRLKTLGVATPEDAAAIDRQLRTLPARCALEAATIAAFGDDDPAGTR